MKLPNDTSDDAFAEFYDGFDRREEAHILAAYAIWREAVRRCEAQIEELEQKIEFLEDQLEYAHYGPDEL